MGYVVKLKSYKEIKESDIKSIIYSLPDYLRGPLDEIKETQWGWPCVCDVHKPDGNELMISGAYNISGTQAQNFVAYMQNELDKMGYDTSVFCADGIILDISTSKDSKINKVTEINHSPAIAFKEFGTSMNNAMESAMEAAKKWSEDIQKDIADKCMQCGNELDINSSKYCEECFQSLISENAKLQLQLKDSIPLTTSKNFMIKLKMVLSNNKRGITNEERLIEIQRLYISYLDAMSGKL